MVEAALWEINILEEMDYMLVLNQGTMQSFGRREEVLAKFRRPAPAVSPRQPTMGAA